MPPTANQQIARAAGTVAFAILFGQLMGLVRGILVAQAFPVSALDAFYAANRVSETLFTLIAAGALGSAFLPTFTGLLVKNETSAAWGLAAALARLVTLALSLLAALLAVFAPQVVQFSFPGLTQDPAQLTLTVDLMRIQLTSSVLFGLGGLVVGILNAHQVFFIPQLTAAMYQIGQIFGAVVLAHWMGIYGLAWGVVIGAALYLAIQIPTLFRLKPVATPQSDWLGWSNPHVRQVFALMGPRVLGAGVVQLNFWVNISLASQMATGSVTSLTYGFALMLMAQAAIAQSVAIAAMPTFSAQFALGQTAQMRSALAAALRGVLFFSIPASVGLILLAQPIIAMLYQRGAFDENAVQLTAWALAWYAAGMVGHAMLEVLTRAFYARQDTRTPVLVGAAAMTLNVAFSFGFAGLFRNMGLMPHGGLALANSLATALEAASLFWLMRRPLGGMNGGEIARGAAQFSAAALGMALGLLAWVQVAGRLAPWAIGLGGVALGGAIYLGLGLILRIPELTTLLAAARRRLRA